MSHSSGRDHCLFSRRGANSSIRLSNLALHNVSRWFSDHSVGILLSTHCMWGTTFQLWLQPHFSCVSPWEWISTDLIDLFFTRNISSIQGHSLRILLCIKSALKTKTGGFCCIVFSLIYPINTDSGTSTSGSINFMGGLKGSFPIFAHFCLVS